MPLIIIVFLQLNLKKEQEIRKRLQESFDEAITELETRINPLLDDEVDRKVKKIIDIYEQKLKEMENQLLGAAKDKHRL